ncbi:alpha/beta fold hydrolase [Neobacillus terrae]|uniref:alpha/beta fold hydrolase n=1 Tax=Neobacillus terrae TaxID=3034837 RepID=UPI00140E497B|nr:alpha/beta fold hydrolase [Neobacillus terrae]NHM30986.1 alpha/beta fold hydrolase [Neobacillus terrae]
MSFKNGEYNVELNGIKHWVKIDGSEHKTRPLIIIHGGPGGNHYTFERTIGPLLTDKRTIVYYEQRGCGRSQKPHSDSDYTVDILIKDFFQLKKWLSTEKVDLLGYSFGGELALEFAYAFPEEINDLVLSGPSLMHSEIQIMIQITGFMSVVNKDLYKQFLLLTKNIFSIDDLYKKIWEMVDTETVDLLLFNNQEIAKKNRQFWEESKLVNTGLMIKALYENPGKIPIELRLKEIRQRTLIITGVFDRNTGVSISNIIHRELSNSSLRLFDKSAHFPDLEETYLFAGTAVEFLES